MKKINDTRVRAIVVCALAVLCGGLLAALRINVLFGSYVHSTGLYPDSSDRTAFEIGTVVLSLSLLLCGIIFASRNEKYKITRLPVAGTFAGGLVGFGFLALAVSVFLTDKINGTALSRFDGVLIVLSLVCAASFWMEGFSEEKMSEDAVSLLMMTRSVCCLLVSFYFYFDKTTVIHDSNKKMATLFFAVVLLALLYDVKLRVAKARMGIYVSLCALSVCYSIMYAVPSLVWYFIHGEGLILSIFFDITGLFLGVWCIVRILSVSSPVCEEGTAAIAEDAAESPEVTEPTEAPEQETETPESPEEITETSESEI